MKHKEELEQMRNILIIIVATAIIILIGVCNLLTVQILLRKPEIKLLQTVGLSSRAIRSILITETSLFNFFGILLGIGLSIFITMQISTDFLLKNLILIPWEIWSIVAFCILAICIICTIVSFAFLKKSLKNNIK